MPRCDELWRNCDQVLVGQACLLAYTFNMVVVERYCERVLLLYDGHLIDFRCNWNLISVALWVVYIIPKRTHGDNIWFKVWEISRFHETKYRLIHIAPWNVVWIWISRVSRVIPQSNAFHPHIHIAYTLRPPYHSIFAFRSKSFPHPNTTT